MRYELPNGGGIACWSSISLASLKSSLVKRQRDSDSDFIITLAHTHTILFSFQARQAL